MKKSVAISIVILLIPVLPALVISGLSSNPALDEGANMGIVSISFAFIEQIFCAFASIILPIVFDCRYQQRDRECIGYVITSSFLNIPTFALIIMRVASYLINPSGIYYRNGNGNNYWLAWADEIDSFFGVIAIGICISLCSVATISVLIKFCHINHQLKNPNYVYK